MMYAGDATLQTGFERRKKKKITRPICGKTEGSCAKPADEKHEDNQQLCKNPGFLSFKTLACVGQNAHGPPKSTTSQQTNTAGP